MSDANDTSWRNDYSGGPPASSNRGDGRVDRGSVDTNGFRSYYGANRFGARDNAENNVFSIGGVRFSADGTTRFNAFGRPVALGPNGSAIGTGSVSGALVFDENGIRNTNGSFGVYNRGFQGGYSGYSGYQGGYNQHSNYPRGGSAAMGGYGAQTIDTGIWNGYDLNIVTDRAINKQDPAQSVLAVLEAQSNSNLYGGSTLPNRDYLPGANIPGFQRVDRNGSVDLPSEQQLQSYLGNQLEELMDQHPQDRSRAEAVALANEIRLQFGDGFAQGVANEMGRNALAELRDITPLTASISAPRQTAASPQNTAQIDQAAQRRLASRTQQLRGLNGADPDQQAAVMRAALGEEGGVGLTEDQITQMRSSLTVIADPTATDIAKAAATTQLASVQPQLEAVAADLNRVDQATRAAFLSELSQDYPDLATQLETMAQAQPSQSTTRNRQSNMLTTEQLETIRFSDPNLRRRYEAAVSSYDQIAKMPVIGPILNMFMESFGMGPHSIIRENAEDIDAIGRSALESITSSNPELAGRIPQEVRNAAATATAQQSQDEPVAQTNVIANNQEAALADKYGVEQGDSITEAHILENAAIAATAIAADEELAVEHADLLADINVGDGIDEGELEKINQIMDSDADLGAAIRAALEGSDITYGGGVANDTNVISGVNTAIDERQAAAGRSQ